MAKVDEILQKLCDYVYNAGASAKHNGIFVGGEPKKEASQAIKAIISDQVAKARIDERSQAQQYLHGLTITPESQHLFDVLSRNNYDRIKEIKRSKE